MSNYYEDSNRLLEQIEENTRGGSSGGNTGLTNAELRASPVNAEVLIETLSPSLTTITATGTPVSGQIATGAQSVAFFNAGTGIVTLNGGNLPVGTSVSFDAGINRLSAINYVVTNSSLLIAEVRP